MKNLFFNVHTFSCTAFLTNHYFHCKDQQSGFSCNTSQWRQTYTKIAWYDAVCGTFSNHV